MGNKPSFQKAIMTGNEKEVMNYINSYRSSGKDINAAFPIYHKSDTLNNHFNNDSNNNIAEDRVHIPDPELYDGKPTPLILAIQSKQINIIRMLIEHGGANVNGMDGYGRYPIHVAAMEDDIEFARPCISYLFHNSANINAIDNEGYTPLHVACDSYTSNLANASFLIELGANIEAVTDTGVRPLHVACMNSNKPVGRNLVHMLVNRGADVNAVATSFHPFVDMIMSIRNFTPIHCTALNDNIEALDILASNGADVNAVARCDIGIISRYIQQIEEIEDPTRFTALYCACVKKNIDMIRILLRHHVVVDDIAKLLANRDPELQALLLSPATPVAPQAPTRQRHRTSKRNRRMNLKKRYSSRKN